MDGVILTPLKQIYHPKGDIFHAMKKSDVGYTGFGEAYFSTIHKDEIKGWKKHTQMTLNLVVPVGEIEFVMHDDREDSLSKGEFLSAILGIDTYQRLTVAPNVWVAFRGLKETNLLLNVASIEHDPTEAITITLDEVPYAW